MGVTLIIVKADRSSADTASVSLELERQVRSEHSDDLTLANFGRAMMRLSVKDPIFRKEVMKLWAEAKERNEKQEKPKRGKDSADFETFFSAIKERVRNAGEDKVTPKKPVPIHVDAWTAAKEREQKRLQRLAAKAARRVEERQKQKETANG